MDGNSQNERFHLLQFAVLFLSHPVFEVSFIFNVRILGRSSLQNSNGVNIKDKFKVKLLIYLISTLLCLQTQKMQTIKCSIVCTALGLLLVGIYFYILKTFHSNVHKMSNRSVFLKINQLNVGTEIVSGKRSRVRTQSQLITFKYEYYRPLSTVLVQSLILICRSPYMPDVFWNRPSRFNVGIFW